MIESLIKKFIQHLNDVEGTDFLHASNLTSEDVALLKKSSRRRFYNLATN
jgi:hypothetical protein